MRTGKGTITTAGTYYIVLVHEVNYRITSNSYLPAPNVEFNWNPTTFKVRLEGNDSGIGITGGGISIVGNTSKVFRVDTQANSYDPFITIVGVTDSGGFNNRYLLDDPDMDSNTATFGSSTGRANVAWANVAAPVCRALGAFRGTSSGNPSLLTMNHPSWNVASVTRSGTGRYYVTLNEWANGGNYLAVVSSFGRQGDSASQNTTDDEHSNNHAVKIDTSNNRIYLTFKDNDKNNNKDPYEVYFYVYG